MARTDYDPLRTAHQAALDAVNSPPQPAHDINPPEPEPTRPEGHYGQQSPGWTSAGGMEQQQASAAQWAKVSQERREDERGRDGGDQPAAEQAQPEQTPGTSRKLVFSEDREREAGERSDSQASREGGERGEVKDQSAGRTLSFYEDRNNDLSRDR